MDLQKLREAIFDFPKQDYRATLSHILQIAIGITGADKGNIQILDPFSHTLSIVVHDGFEEPFLRFFKDVNGREAAACGTALKQLARVIIPDVRESPIFAGTESLDVLLGAGVQAVQSTPLVANGSIVGMISTHYRVPTYPTGERLHFLNELAQIAADYILEIRTTSDSPCDNLVPKTH